MERTKQLLLPSPYMTQKHGGFSEREGSEAARPEDEHKQSRRIVALREGAT